MEELIYEVIGKRIREARENREWTQQEFGDKVGLTRTSITNIERGKQKLQIDSLYKFASVLGVSPFSLLPDESVLLDIELPSIRKNLNEYDADVIAFTKKVYLKSKREMREDNEHTES